MSGLRHKARARIHRAKAHWRWFKSLTPGRRFQREHERHQSSVSGRSWLVRATYPLLAVLALAVGVVLAFIPGPAFVFFGAAGALLAMESMTIARLLDRGEVWARISRERARRRWRAYRSRHA